MRSLASLIAVIGLSLTRCSSTPSASGPAWVSQPTRTVDAGYVVYVGRGEDASPERASRKAELAAWNDLANECSFVPKVARLEDRFSRPGGEGTEAFAKVAVVFEDCEAARKATDPETIRSLANATIAEDLKAYHTQFFSGTDEQPPAAQAGDGTVASADVIADDPQFYWYRQQVAQQKIEVILAPPATYAVGTPARVHFIETMNTRGAAITQYEHVHPQIKSLPSTWSTHHPFPRIGTPMGMPTSTPRGMPSLSPRRHEFHDVPMRMPTHRYHGGGRRRR